ncbi:retron Ec78 anti-phage system effector HNH endonuclease PtuB [Pseudomonas viridiflava]|uniref:retron Ec78 anti-phage system effector HNH endonuclease PtuB n=1 Tax=Pseudomonas viridiflava TaxID=33069 RepID=UPI001C314183|nr:retron Ec78 anti-phage system effector HNH endonuclease PtuB [Pseudomonas viridiflava]QXG48192.1 TIGR02646 family protein [Pseudomonas viridiflava]
MHRLHRQDEPPSGLRRYRHGLDKWSATCPTQEEREGIWTSLESMQGPRCAYCEGPIDLRNRQIEHFRQRGRYPQGTFEWTNLFGSCKRAGTCGNAKDQCGIYPPEVLIKPDIEDPDTFLVFTPGGTVEPRAGLSARDHLRASETIRILALDGALNEIRRAELRGYLQTLEYFVEFAEAFPEDEGWVQELQQEVLNVAHLPYATAIRHVLTRQSE